MKTIPLAALVLVLSAAARGTPDQNGACSNHDVDGKSWIFAISEYQNVEDDPNGCLARLREESCKADAAIDGFGVVKGDHRRYVGGRGQYVLTLVSAGDSVKAFLNVYTRSVPRGAAALVEGGFQRLFVRGFAIDAPYYHLMDLNARPAVEIPNNGKGPKILPSDALDILPPDVRERVCPASR
jgi:hypothetical protein